MAVTPSHHTSHTVENNTKLEYPNAKSLTDTQRHDAYASAPSNTDSTTKEGLRLRTD